MVSAENSALVLFFISFVVFLPEPGYYEDGSFGIRIENVVLVVPAKAKVGPLTENQIKCEFQKIEKKH